MNALITKTDDEVHQMLTDCRHELAAKDARIAELEAALQCLYGACIDADQNIDPYFSALEKAETALGMFEEAT